MNDMEIISIAVSVASLLVAFLAIWLATKFYEMSTKASEDTREAARGIKSSVDKLEMFFKLLYADTFSIMKETVTDLRKHALSGIESATDISEMVEQKASEKIEKIREEMQSEISRIAVETKKTDVKVGEIENSITELIEKVIKESRYVEKEAVLETVKDSILEELSILEEEYGYTEVAQLNRRLIDRFSFRDIKKGIYQLHLEGKIALNRKIEKWTDIGPGTIMHLR